MFFVDRSFLASVKIPLCLVIRNLNCSWNKEYSGNLTLCTHITRRCEVPTAATVRITVSSDVAACSAVDIYQNFAGTCSLHLQCLKMDVAGSTALHRIKEECSLHYKEFLQCSSLFGMLFAG
jgi:hypothetical protein